MPYKNIEERRKKDREYYHKNKNTINAYQREYRKQKMEIVMNHYGRICACCGETEPMFLTIDHKNEDGCKHRKEIKYKYIHQYLIEEGFPDTFEVLCWNCNCGKNRNKGICPHKVK